MGNVPTVGANERALPAAVSEHLLRALLDYGATLSAKDDLVFGNHPQIGDLLSDDPFAFLLAASLDRGMVAETAWQIPGKLRRVLGHLDPARIAVMSKEEVLAALHRISGKPRYLRDAPLTILGVARLVHNDLGGDARRLWRGQPPQAIRRRLEGIFGVGPGIAAMVVNLLSQLGEIEVRGEHYATMDVKPDVHVQRVFKRLGFCAGESEAETLDAARRLHTQYPGKLDAPAWHIGRTWCHAQHPQCASCPLGKPCPRLL